MHVKCTKIPVIILIISSTSTPFLKLLVVVLKKRKCFYSVWLADCRYHVFLLTTLLGGDDVTQRETQVKRNWLILLVLPYFRQQFTWTYPPRFKLQCVKALVEDRAT